MSHTDRYRDQHGEQLKMFMSAREIKQRYEPLDADREERWVDEHGNDVDDDDERGVNTRFETNDEMWERKADESWGYGLHHDIMEHGVTHPVHLGDDEVVGGHHRIASMGDEAPDELMPVLHHESIHDAQGAHSPWYVPPVDTTKYYPYT